MTHLQSTELHIYSDPQNCHIALDTKDLNHIWVDSVIWCVTHPWSQKAISGMSNCQHRGAIALPWIGHAFHCPSYWFQPQDLFDGFNIFNIVNISLPLILIPATRSVWRFKYFQFRDETGINICAVLEMELASDHFIQWWSYLLVVIFFPSWRSYCRWSWKLCGDKILHNYASASSWESVHYMTLLPYYTISSHYHPIIASLIINRRITLMSMMWDGEMRMVAKKDTNQKTTQK